MCGAVSRSMNFDNPQNTVYYSRTALIRTLVVWIANCTVLVGTFGKFVSNSTQLTCFEITGYWIKYCTFLWLLEL